MEAVRAIEFAAYNQDKLSPMTIFVIFVAGLSLMLLPRGYAIVPMLAVACFVHYEQRTVIGEMDFDMRRLMVVFGLVRLVVRREVVLEINKLDKLIICWAASMAFVPVIRDPSQLVWALGATLDNVVGYVVLKAIVMDHRSVEVAASWLALFSLPIAGCMLHEVSNLTNPFHIFGAPEGVFERDGEIRASASFDHPILAGTFGGVVLPFAYILWNKGGANRLLAFGGLVASFIIVYTSKSSGPLYGYLGAILGISLWKARRHIRKLRNAFWISLCVLQIFMKAPVYAVIFRIPDAIGLISSSTSYHRYMVIDLAVRNFKQWWLIGISSDIVATWGDGAQDVTNQYVAVGLTSGLLGVTLFVLTLIRAFSLTGQCVRALGADLHTQKIAWGLGSLLFMHVVSFLGVNYFSGFWFFLLLTVAMISSYCSSWVAETKAVVAADAKPLEPQYAG